MPPPPSLAGIDAELGDQVEQVLRTGDHDDFTGCHHFGMPDDPATDPVLGEQAQEQRERLCRWKRTMSGDHRTMISGERPTNVRRRSST